jgi:hypothetical protein
MKEHPVSPDPVRPTVLIASLLAIQNERRLSVAFVASYGGYVMLCYQFFRIHNRVSRICSNSKYDAQVIGSLMQLMRNYSELVFLQASRSSTFVFGLTSWPRLVSSQLIFPCLLRVFYYGLLRYRTSGDPGHHDTNLNFAYYLRRMSR